jgi:hypothetical protein
MTLPAPWRFLRALGPRIQTFVSLNGMYLLVHDSRVIGIFWSELALNRAALSRHARDIDLRNRRQG